MLNVRLGVITPKAYQEKGSTAEDAEIVIFSLTVTSVNHDAML